MNLKQIVSYQERFCDLKKQVATYLETYMSLISKRIYEIGTENSDIMYIKKNDINSIMFNFYEYSILIKKCNTFGVPEEFNKTRKDISIKGIIEEKSDVLCGCISFYFSDSINDADNYKLLGNLFINNDGVYRMGTHISGGKNTFKDDCKAVLYETIGNIYTLNYPKFDIEEIIEM